MTPLLSSSNHTATSFTTEASSSATRMVSPLSSPSLSSSQFKTSVHSYGYGDAHDDTACLNNDRHLLAATSSSKNNSTPAMITTRRAEERLRVALDAASLGRLSRLPEAIVEAVADGRNNHHQNCPHSGRYDDDDDDDDDQQCSSCWTLKRSMQTQVLKSSFQRCIQEAAAVGLVKRLEPVEIVSNHSTNSYATNRSSTDDSESESDGDDEKNNNNEGGSTSGTTTTTTGPQSRRRRRRGQQQRRDGTRGSCLLEAHVRRSREAKARSWSSPRAILDAYQQEDDIRQSWHTTTSTTSASTTTTCSSSSNPISPLPSPMVPRWRRKFSGMTPKKLRECLAMEAANRAFDRIWRLENQSDQELKVRDGCACIYCGSGPPTPYQTQAYQQLSKDPTYFPPSTAPLWMDVDLVDQDEDDDASIDSDRKKETVIQIKNNLPSPILPSLKTKVKPLMPPPPPPFFADEEAADDFAGALVDSSSASPCSSKMLKESLDRILPEVAAKAWDRAVKLQRKGQAHSVTDRCSCTYCVTASPLQTRRYKRLEQLQQQQELQKQRGGRRSRRVTKQSREPNSAVVVVLGSTSSSVATPSSCSRSLTPPPTHYRRSAGGQPGRCASTPMGRGGASSSSSSNKSPTTATIRKVARRYNEKNGVAMPSWVSPLSNRKHIQCSSSSGDGNGDGDYQQQVESSSPSGVVVTSSTLGGDNKNTSRRSSFLLRASVDAPPIFQKDFDAAAVADTSNKSNKKPIKKQSLDGDIDEEEILEKEIWLLS